MKDRNEIIKNKLTKTIKKFSNKVLPVLIFGESEPESDEIKDRYVLEVNSIQVKKVFIYENKVYYENEYDKLVEWALKCKCKENATDRTKRKYKKIIESEIEELYLPVMEMM